MKGRATPSRKISVSQPTSAHPPWRHTQSCSCASPRDTVQGGGTDAFLSSTRQDHFAFVWFVLMCLFPTEDRVGWQNEHPLNAKAEEEILSLGSSRRGCIRRRKRLGLKTGSVNETLDEVF